MSPHDEELPYTGRLKPLATGIGAEYHDRAVALTCAECGAYTAHRKPYCPRHVHLMPYVAGILATLRANEERLAAALHAGDRQTIADDEDLRELYTCSLRKAGA